MTVAHSADTVVPAWAIVDALGVGIVVQLADGRIGQANARAEQILGLTRDQIAGRTSADPRWRSIHEDGSPFPGDTHPAMVTLRTGVPAEDVVMGVHRPDGSLSWIAITTQPLRHDGGTAPYAVVATFRDITAQHDAEAQVRAGQARMRALFQNAPLNSIIWRFVRDDAGMIVDWIAVDLNEGGALASGRSAAEAIGLRASELCGSGTMGPYIEISREVDRTGVPTTFETHFDFNDSDYLSACFLLGDDEYAILSVDTTAIRHAERSLAETRGAYRRLVERLPVGVYASHFDDDLNLTFDFVSSVAGEILDVDPAEAMADAMLPFRRMHPDDLPPFVAGIREAARSGTPFSSEPRVRIREEWRVIRFASHPNPLGPDGSISRSGFLEDVTDRVRAKAELEAGRRELAEAQRIARTGSWTWNPATGEATWSDEMFRIYGLPPDSPIPSLEGSADTYGGDSHARMVEIVRAAAGEGRPYEVDLEIVQPGGGRVQAVGRGEPVCDESGRVILLRGTCTDVTEERETEARLREAERAEAVGRLAGGVAHEFNNALAAISGYAEFLARATPADDPRADDIAAIQEAVRHSVSLIKQLLAFGRRRLLRPERLDLREVVDGLTPILRELAGEGVTLNVRLGGRPAPIVSDRAMLDEMLVNLVVNARDALPAGGRLDIALGQVVHAGDDPRLVSAQCAGGPYVVLSVSDNGSGIPRDLLPHVFEPFFSTKGVGQGSGLGLSSVLGAVQATGGFIEVDSEVGEGTVFTANLPLALRDR